MFQHSANENSKKREEKEQENQIKLGKTFLGAKARTLDLKGPSSTESDHLKPLPSGIIM